MGRCGVGKLTVLVWLGLLVADGGCQDHGYRQRQGPTMGTSWTVRAACAGDLIDAAAEELGRVDELMSTYREDSELSRFNSGPVGTWIDLSVPLQQVLEAAIEVSDRSGGAFDVTVGPLVNLWGFGPGPAGTHVPAQPAIDAARARVGYGRLEIRRHPPAARKRAEVTVDLSAIAKGYGVDRVAERLLDGGCTNFMVEVGGEVRAHGVNGHGRAWRIGIEQPERIRAGGVAAVLTLSDGGVATSGDYRNVIVLDGESYSHTIDPRTGRPVPLKLASVTVVHASAMWADGYATAIMALGADDGLQFAERTGLAAYLLTRTPDGYGTRYTAAMNRYLDPPSPE